MSAGEECRCGECKARRLGEGDRMDDMSVRHTVRSEVGQLDDLAGPEKEVTVV
jgi:hypothetical protein